MEETLARASLIGHLCTIQRDWYSATALISAVGCDEEVGLDALCNLEVDNFIQIRDFEDGPRVKIRRHVTQQQAMAPKLTAEQQAWVESNIPMADAAVWEVRTELDKDERRSAAYFGLCLAALIQIKNKDVSRETIAYTVIRRQLIADWRYKFRYGRGGVGKKAMSNHDSDFTEILQQWNALQDFENKEEAKVVMGLVEKLDDDCKEIIKLTLGGHSLDVIALKVGASRSAVKRRKSKAIFFIREHLVELQESPLQELACAV
jgi:RNA polymerase sigma factor (sigma-70 family)